MEERARGTELQSRYATRTMLAQLETQQLQHEQQEEQMLTKEDLEALDELWEQQEKEQKAVSEATPMEIEKEKSEVQKEEEEEEREEEYIDELYKEAFIFSAAIEHVLEADPLGNTGTTTFDELLNIIAARMSYSKEYDAIAIHPIGEQTIYLTTAAMQRIMNGKAGDRPRIRLIFRDPEKPQQMALTPSVTSLLLTLDVLLDFIAKQSRYYINVPLAVWILNTGISSPPKPTAASPLLAAPKATAYMPVYSPSSQQGEEEQMEQFEEQEPLETGFLAPTPPIHSMEAMGTQEFLEKGKKGRAAAYFNTLVKALSLQPLELSTAVHQQQLFTDALLKQIAYLGNFNRAVGDVADFTFYYKQIASSFSYTLRSPDLLFIKSENLLFPLSRKSFAILQVLESYGHFRIISNIIIRKGNQVSNVYLPAFIRNAAPYSISLQRWLTYIPSLQSLQTKEKMEEDKEEEEKSVDPALIQEVEQQRLAGYQRFSTAVPPSVESANRAAMYIQNVLDELYQTKREQSTPDPTLNTLREYLWQIAHFSTIRFVRPVYGIKVTSPQKQTTILTRDQLATVQQAQKEPTLIVRIETSSGIAGQADIINSKEYTLSQFLRLIADYPSVHMQAWLNYLPIPKSKK